MKKGKGVMQAAKRTTVIPSPHRKKSSENRVKSFNMSFVLYRLLTVNKYLLKKDTIPASVVTLHPCGGGEILRVMCHPAVAASPDVADAGGSDSCSPGAPGWFVAWPWAGSGWSAAWAKPSDNCWSVRKRVKERYGQRTTEEKERSEGFSYKGGF